MKLNYVLYIYILVKNSSKCKHSNIFVLLYIDNFQDILI